MTDRRDRDPARHPGRPGDRRGRRPGPVGPEPGCWSTRSRRRAPTARRTWRCSGSACSATPPRRTAYVRDLVDWLDLDPRPPASWPTAWSRPGWSRPASRRSGSPTTARSCARRSSASISAVTAPLYESLSPSDVETTVRTLRDLTTAGAGADSWPSRPGRRGRAHDHAEPGPGSSDAARHGTGDADLTIMLAAHAAFRRDLAQLARAAAFADLPDPGDGPRCGPAGSCSSGSCTCTTRPRTTSSGRPCASG